jgi:BirA family transcriptional regulator, biotin operon repressor / biotin---[acetyl-CoA-carboxylase] ligase
VTRVLRFPVERHLSLDSTNDEAFRRAQEGAPEGLVVSAYHQTHGRGRHGRSWFDESGRCLMFSILLRPKIPLPSYPLLALALASSVADAGGEILGEPLDVKWPNDVLHRGRKLCGVLAESRALHPGEAPALVLGAGVNVNLLEEDFPEDLRAHATSLRVAAGGREIPMAPLFESILARFDREATLARDGDPAALFARVRARLPQRGAHVRVVLPGRVVDGELLDVIETGALRVRDGASGAVETLAAGVLE